jgi:hypothetical protein
MGPLNNQFAFCVYIAARVLLLYWRYSSIDCLSPEFWLLIQSLEAMSKRWAGLVGPQDNLASKYSATLIQLHAQCTQDESFAISIPAYTTEVKHSKVPLQTPSGGLDRRQWLRNEAPNVPSPQLRTTYSATELVSQYTPVNISSNAISLGHSTEPYSGGSGSGGELGMISQMLFDAQFADMDRVISFDDGMFEGGGDM